MEAEAWPGWAATNPGGPSRGQFTVAKRGVLLQPMSRRASSFHMIEAFVGSSIRFSMASVKLEFPSLLG